MPRGLYRGCLGSKKRGQTLAPLSIFYFIVGQAIVGSDKTHPLYTMITILYKSNILS